MDTLTGEEICAILQAVLEVIFVLYRLRWWYFYRWHQVAGSVVDDCIGSVLLTNWAEPWPHALQTVAVNK